ncbi:GDSL esterase/lipase At4g10955-like isoform X2 [Sesamum indicum]|nr:GDSL esterase/lipase At4g10955-like isoform X2 [Sesamum indicum]XP_020554403.1 GDSL esterase/lipase At4g10955-like isoform X2 [Sesamum indicum]
MACFVQAVYLLELDRQENRTNQTALAPQWWIPFKYKLVETLIDERDGSIFGAIFEWDRAAALIDFVPVRPSGAPKAVLAFRGTLLKTPTIRRDIEDDLRFLAWESLKGSVRFSSGLKALRSISDKYGSSKICIAGHSLGASFAHQVGRALAEDGTYVEAHLFNPPSVSLSSGLKNMGEKVGDIWKRFRSRLPSTAETTPGLKQWVPHLYINNSDYICCYYTDANQAEELKVEKANAKSTNTPCATDKLYVLSKGKQKFLEAHGLQQWWSDDLELQMALNNSKLISKQLKSLYTLPPTEQSPSKG